MRNSTIQPPLGTQLNRSHSMSQRLIGSWLMNEGGGQKIFDNTGINNIAGALTNGAVFKQMQKGNAVSFDGVNDYIDAGNNSILMPGTGNFSISIWINAANANQAGVILQKRNAGATSLYSISVDDNVDSLTSGKRIGAAFISNVATRSVDTTSAIVDGNWHNIVVTWVLSGNTLLIYIDGVAAPLTVRSTISTLINITPDVSFKIGSNTGSAFFFNGAMQNLKIWNRALSATEVRQLYVSPYSMYK